MRQADDGAVPYGAPQHACHPLNHLRLPRSCFQPVCCAGTSAIMLVPSCCHLQKCTAAEAFRLKRAARCPSHHIY